MKTSYETKTPQTLNTRSLIIVVLAVGAVTGGNLWLHREDLPLGYVEYSDFGFSFVHPQLLPTYSCGYPSASGANDFGGVVQAKGLWEGIWRNFMVVWSTEAATPDLGAELDDFYALMNDKWDCVIDNKGELLSSEKDGHEMLLQSYTFWEDSFRPGGAQFIAASGVWYEIWPPLRANRVYILTYIAFPELTTRQQVLERFQHYLDSFVGNEAVS